MSSTTSTPAAAQSKAKTNETHQEEPVAAPRWWQTWNPDRRWLHPLVTALWLHLLSWVSLTGLSAWWLLLGGLAFTAVLMVLGVRAAPASRFGDLHPRQITWLAAVTGLTGTAWLVWMGLHGPLDGPGLGAWVIGTVVFGALYAGWRSHSPERAAATTRAERIREEAALRSEWTDILAAAGVKNMHVVDRKPHQAGYTLLLEHRRPGGPDARGTATVTLNHLRNAAAAIAAEAARALAHTGAVIHAKGIRAEETDYAHRFTLHVTTIDVLKASLPFQPRTLPASFLDPARVGLYEVGDPVDLTLAGIHGKIVGATQSGKSVLLNNMFARILECNNAVLWVGGVSKLVPLVYPWLLPWLTGRTSRPAIDWVAGEDQREVLTMLAAMYHAAKVRTELLTIHARLVPSVEIPALVGILDEASTALTDPTTIKTFDGHEWNASRLFSEVTQIGAAVNVTLWQATQYGLFPSSGSYGSEMHRNMGVRIALKTMSSSDGRDTLVGMTNVDTTKLRHKSMLVQPNAEEARALPAKAFYLEGASLVGPLVERVTPHLASLDEFTAGKLAGYADRWTPERCATIASVLQREQRAWPTDGQAAAAPAGAAGSAPDLADQKVIDARFAELTGGLKTTDDKPAAKPARDTSTRGKEPTTADDLSKGMEHLADGMQAANERMGAVHRIGDPLAAIASALGLDGAPKGDMFVSTRELAIATGRTTRDASEEQQTAAAIALGREINKQVPALKTVQRSIEGKQVRGYLVRSLWAAIHHLAYGKPMPTDDAE